METGSPLHDTPEQPMLSAPSAAHPSSIFHNDHGLRSGWRLLVYLLLVLGGGAIFVIGLRVFLAPTRGLPSTLSVLMQEVVGFALVYGAALIMSQLEKRPVGVYGLPMSDALGGKFWLGFLFGLVEVSVLVGLIAVFGGYSFGSLALQGGEIVRWGLFHLLLFFFVGLFEEFLFRGYMQFTLGDGIGFWPAAILLSVLFGGIHLGNPGEGLVGAAGVAIVAIFFCFTLQANGKSLVCGGAPCEFRLGGNISVLRAEQRGSDAGHLSNAALHGPKWLTGGSVGPEGSVFCFLTMGLQFLVVDVAVP